MARVPGQCFKSCELKQQNLSFCLSVCPPACLSALNLYLLPLLKYDLFRITILYMLSVNQTFCRRPNVLLYVSGGRADGWWVEGWVDGWVNIK